MLIYNFAKFLCTDIFKVIRMTKILYPLNVKIKHNYKLSVNNGFVKTFKLCTGT